MAAEIRLELKTEQGLHRINVRSFLEATAASAKLLQELDRTLAEGKFDWYFSELGAGSAIAVFEGEWMTTDDERPADLEITRASEHIADRYLSGLELLEREAEWPADYTVGALQAAQRLAQVQHNGVKGIVVSIPAQRRFAVLTESLAANVNDVLDEWLGDRSKKSAVQDDVPVALDKGGIAIGSVEGIVNGIDLRRAQPTFLIRDDVTGRDVACNFSRTQVGEVGNALDRRVLVAGEVRYSKDGQPVEVRAVDLIRVLEDRELPTVDDIRGIAPDFTDGMPSEVFVNRLRDQDG